MGVTNQDILDTASTTFNAAFEEIFDNGPQGQFLNYTEVIPTDSLVNELDVIEAMPVVRQWVGAKQFGDVYADSLSCTVVPYEKSFAINRLKARADRTGMIGRKINQFLRPGGDGNAFVDKLAFDERVANNTCYDGVALYSGSHVRGPAGATQSNTSTTALSFAQHDAVMQVGASLRASNGENLGIAYNVLTVGPKLAKIAKEITQSNERIIAVDNAGAETGTRVAASTIPNVFGGGQMLLVIDPRLVGTYDDYYYYDDTNRGPKAVVCFEFRAPEPQVQTEMSDEGRFLHDELRFSVEADLGWCPGAWQVSYAGIVS